MTRRHASTGSATSARLGFGAVALALLCGFFYIGCDGVTPPNGGGGSSEEATIRGTVTNDATGEALVGAKVSIGDMAEATTDDAGEYSQTVPIGVYDLSFENDFFTTVQQTIAGATARPRRWTSRCLRRSRWRSGPRWKAIPRRMAQ
jgi:hypothetical protein